MGLQLTRSPSELRELFLALKTPRDVAALLEIDYSRMVYHLYKVPPAAKYRLFSIPKRRGGSRQICAPFSPLIILQRKLNHILHAVRPPKPCVHGFVRQRSIRTNALVHTRRRCILNLDLADFFPSISGARVHGMFRGKPYNLPPKVATTLAQICCFNNQLPQGAPSSPIVSNMICAQMDSQLQALAKQHRCLYTRYADDITFSTRSRSFPDAIARLHVTPTETLVEVGEALSHVITKNGFKVNPDKLRLAHRNLRQEVTGLVVNDFPNVPRPYIRRLRAMLHAWDKFGEEKAEADFYEKFDRKGRTDPETRPAFRTVVKGMIDFVAMARAKSGPAYYRLLEKYAQCDPSYKLPVLPPYELESVFKALWIIVSEDLSGNITSQSTAFSLQDYGIVTCAHALMDEPNAFTVWDPATCSKHLRPNLHAFRAWDCGKRFSVKPLMIDPERDLAVIQVDGDTDCRQVLFPRRDPILRDDQLIVVGFPNYAPGNSPYTCRGRVTTFRQRFCHEHIVTNAVIASGNSGGPVVDNQFNVIGIAVTGAYRLDQGHKTDYHCVIPMSTLDELLGVRGTQH